jgi:hypothetical protein
MRWRLLAIADHRTSRIDDHQCGRGQLDLSSDTPAIEVGLVPIGQPAFSPDN